MTSVLLDASLKNRLIELVYRDPFRFVRKFPLTEQASFTADLAAFMRAEEAQNSPRQIGACRERVAKALIGVAEAMVAEDINLACYAAMMVSYAVGAAPTDDVTKRADEFFVELDEKLDPAKAPIEEAKLAPGLIAVGQPPAAARDPLLHYYAMLCAARALPLDFGGGTFSWVEPPQDRPAPIAEKSADDEGRSDVLLHDYSVGTFLRGQVFIALFEALTDKDENLYYTMLRDGLIGADAYPVGATLMALHVHEAIDSLYREIEGDDRKAQAETLVGGLVILTNIACQHEGETLLGRTAADLYDEMWDKVHALAPRVARRALKDAETSLKSLNGMAEGPLAEVLAAKRAWLEAQPASRMKWTLGGRMVGRLTNPGQKPDRPRAAPPAPGGSDAPKTGPRG